MEETEGAEGGRQTAGGGWKPECGTPLFAIPMSLTLSIWPVPQDFLNGVCTNVVHMGSKQLNYYAGVMCGGEV